LSSAKFEARKSKSTVCLIISFFGDSQIGQLSLFVEFALITPNRDLALDQVGKDKTLTLTIKRGGD
jgi:hypothetical protein